MADNVEDVAGKVQSLSDSWNPPVEDDRLARLVGTPPGPRQSQRRRPLAGSRVTARTTATTVTLSTVVMTTGTSRR